MFGFIFRRLVQAVLTVFGVMLLTFLLFRIIAGDVSASYVNVKLGAEARQAFYEKHKLDRPVLINYHRRLQIVDYTAGEQAFNARDLGGSQASKVLDLTSAAALIEPTLLGRLVFSLSGETPIEKLTEGKPLCVEGESAEPEPALNFRLADGSTFSVEMADIETCGDLLNRINEHPNNAGRLKAAISDWSPKDFFESQFFWHLWETLTFSGRSYTTEQKLQEIIVKRARYSLAITVPALALGWLSSMVIACFVAYYRGRFIDEAGVFLSVLGMCIPFLAYMIYGQWLMFTIAPSRAFGLASRANVYVPVLIAVVAGLGGSVRFYRTVILDQVNQDYVRTALAKGVPLTGILFKHVLKNCMLPILTNLVLAIPFLIMGSLLLERFFGIPGLGDLMINSISTRDVPIITGLTFLTAVIYVIGLLITDILYAVFDPRIRLR
ncbi:MAG: ABC transporter permease [Planctomycetota bacterium]|jgi:peptide/nickel transport system permease protein